MSAPGSILAIFAIFLRLSNDFHGILALTCNWTHFCDFGQSMRLSHHCYGMSILTRTWTHFGDICQFLQLDFDSHGKLTLIRTLTHFGDFSQSLRLSNDFHGILALTLNWTHFCDLVNPCDFLIIFMGCQYWPALGPILEIFASFYNLISILMGSWHWFAP